MLNVGELSRIAKELILNLPPSNPSQEAMEARREIEADMIQMRADGIMPDLPSDFDFDLPPPPPPSPVPTEEELLESKKRVVRASLASSWGFALVVEAEEKAEKEACGAVLGRIERGPAILTLAERDAYLAEIAELERTNALPASTVRYLVKVATRRAMPPPKKRRKKKKRSP